MTWYVTRSAGVATVADVAKIADAAGAAGVFGVVVRTEAETEIGAVADFGVESANVFVVREAFSEIGRPRLHATQHSLSVA